MVPHPNSLNPAVLSEVADLYAEHQVELEQAVAYGEQAVTLDESSYSAWNALGWARLRFGQAGALALLIAAVNWLLISGTMRFTRVDERTS